MTRTLRLRKVHYLGKADANQSSWYVLYARTLRDVELDKNDTALRDTEPDGNDSAMHTLSSLTSASKCQ
jgi:hypothetical protein